MKKTFTKFLAALMLLAIFTPSMIAVGQTRAEVEYYTLDGTITATGNAYASASSVTQNSMTWSVVANTEQNPWRIGGKSITKVDRTIKSTTTMGSAISKVEVSVGATASSLTVNSIKLIVASDANFNTVLDEITKTSNLTSTTLTFTPTSGTEWTTGAYYNIVFNVTRTSSSGNGYVTFNNAKFYKQEGSTPSCDAPTFSPAEGAIVAGSAVTISTTTSGATIYYTTNGSTPTTSSSVYSSPITVNSDMTIKAMAAASGYDNSSVASASYVVVEHAGTAADPYSIADAYTVIDANVGLSNVYVAGIISQVDSYSSQYNSITYWISEDGETTSDQLEVYSGKGLNNTNFSAITDVEVGAEVVVYGTLKKFNDTYEFDKNNYLTSYTAPQHDVATPTFSPVAGVYASAQSVTISCETTGASIYYTTNGSDPDANSTLYNGTALSISSTTTIKAIAYLAGVNSNIATATYYFCSAENPYTVTEALAFESYQYPANGIYVTGIVSTAATSLSSGTLTYYISVDGTTTADELEVYKGKDLNNASFTAVDDIKVGDIVTVYGNVQVYNSTIEFGSGNYLVSFERPVVPVINASDVNLTYDATSGEIAYTIDDPTTGTSLTATTTADWISNVNVTSEKVTFTCTANDGTTDRTATFTLSYTGAASKTVTVTQGHYTVDYAELPFAFDGGKADIAETTGLTQNGLDSDYASSPYLKFKGQGTWVILHINEAPGTLTFDIKGNSLSGNYQFDLMTSVDGETYLTHTSYTSISGSTESKTINDLNSNVRYIKWVYTTKASGNVALGNIALDEPSTSPIIIVDNTLNLAYNATSGSIDYSITNPTSATLTATLESGIDWISNVNVTGDKVTFTTTANNGTEDRTAIITLAYTGATSETVTVTQAHYVAPAATATYKLATSIVSGKQYIIVGENEGNYYAMGYNKGNNRHAVAISVNGTIATASIAATETDAHEFTITSLGGDYYSIMDATTSGGYLYAGSSSGNQLKTEATLDENHNGDWNITIDNGTFSIAADQSSNRNVMQFNTSGLFNCYSSASQAAVYLYEKVYTIDIAGHGGNKGKYYLITSPLSSATSALNVENLIDTNLPDFDLYKFNQSAEKEWVNWKNNGNLNGFNLVAGTGYLYANANDVTLVFDGTLYSGDGTFGLTYDSQAPNFAGWNLVGNPYTTTATIDKASFYRMNSVGTDVEIVTGGTVNPMEGIFVLATTTGQSVTFTQGGAKRAENAQVSLNIVNNRGNVIDRAIVSFDENGNMPKFMIDETNTKIYFPQSEGNYAIVSSNGEGSMPVNFKAKEMGMYTISVETEGIDLNSLHLIDRLTGENVNLLLDSKYSFIASSSDMESRFILSFGENGINANGNETFAFQNGSDIIVNGEGELQVFDVMGRMVSNTIVNGVEAIALPQGVYIFKMNANVQKIVVR